MVSTGAKLDVSTWDGTLSSCEFRLSAIAFAERWKRFNSAALPHWLWISSSNLPWIAANEAEGYLSLEDVILNGHTEDNHDEGCHTEEEEPSYSDGQPLALGDIEKDLLINSAKVLMESKWTFITQEEHPYLNRPWYTLHPCGTGEWMKLLVITDPSWAKGEISFEKYLISWLSVVGQVVGLRIPFEMCNYSSIP
ncbi:ubiquitin-like-conjugating enzyme ATG10 isoform X3 [Diospyros lotus]|uniref:ubiquitin-like-conjugating enzyme ATG10 isoform X3 n=1 Tax=Diospyros lotus TaxID=55363 RepID=UPI00224D38B1|nr:ubiquitin-like-conjugating enzyme ATG10 isoform X3 [Diospyros lotus]